MSFPPEYPQELTEDEADLGFRLLEVEALGEAFRQSRPAVAVVRILSPCSILVNSSFGYDHLIFGNNGIPTVKGNPAWSCGTDERITNAALFLHDYELGLCKPSIVDVETRIFSYKEA